MRPCVGIHEVCPPLAKWSDFHDGTYNLHDALLFNIVLDEQLNAYNKAMSKYG